jgi:hypothetical protein
MLIISTARILLRFLTLAAASESGMIGAPAALGEGPAAVSGPGGFGGARKVSVAGLGEGLPVDAVAQADVGVVAGRTLLQELTLAQFFSGTFLHPAGQAGFLLDGGLRFIDPALRVPLFAVPVEQVAVEDVRGHAAEKAGQLWVEGFALAVVGGQAQLLGVYLQGVEPEGMIILTAAGRV